MKSFWKAQILEIAESDIFCEKNEATMTILQTEVRCHQYLPSSKHFFVQKLPSKMYSKTLTSWYFSPQGCGPKATARSLKLTRDNGADQTV